LGDDGPIIVSGTKNRGGNIYSDVHRRHKWATQKLGGLPLKGFGNKRCRFGSVSVANPYRKGGNVLGGGKGGREKRRG